MSEVGVAKRVMSEVGVVKREGKDLRIAVL